MSDTIEAVNAAIKALGTQEKLADAVCVRQQSVSQWLNGQKRPSAFTAKRIEAATKGAVTKEAIRPDIFC